MPAIRLVATIGVITMTVALVLGWASGGFGAEGGEILELVWGRITLIDLYLGVALIATFVVWREGSLRRAWPWLVGFVLLGNLATAIYIARAAWASASVPELLARRPA